MKNSIIALLATAVVSQGALVQFDLSPPGTDRATGLSPANEVPAVTNSAGTGGVISGGITFDPTNGVLNLAVGYGSAAGFSNLTGAATAAHLHGPATTGVTANVVVDLGALVFPANDPAQGGVIFGSTTIPTNAVADLLAGLYYMNIHTATNSSGEIRGQLIVHREPNDPPTLVCPPSSIVECSNRPTTLTALVGDPDGDPLTVVWTVNGAPVQTNQVPATSGTNAPVPVNVSLSAEFPLGTNVIDISVADDASNTVTCASSLVVLDRIAPVISSATASPNRIWPPNHKMVDVKLSVTVKDQCGPANWKIISVTSNEPINGLGDGDTTPDWEIVGNQFVRLRAERSGKGGGRTYTIKVQAQDAANNLSTVTSITVVVPKSQGK